MKARTTIPVPRNGGRRGGSVARSIRLTPSTRGRKTKLRRGKPQTPQLALVPGRSELQTEAPKAERLWTFDPGKPAVHEPELERPAYDSNSALNLYLQEIGKTPLLTPVGEIELAAKIKKGDLQAREQMIKANLRLVVKIARDYEFYGMPLLDLINEGNIGLMKGVERFDPSKGAKFSTYGSWWIKQSIKRALANQSKTIRLPVHVVDKVAHIRRVSTKLQGILGREPEDDEIAEELGTSPYRVRQYRAAAVTPMSLDAPLGDDDSHRIGEIVEDEAAESPYQELEDKNSGDLVRQMLRRLDPREAAILSLRFNIEGDHQQTLEEIGKKFGVTRERIRQIQQSALKKLRRMIEKFEARSLKAA
jgi:RNA polymerase primary sigma factor